MYAGCFISVYSIDDCVHNWIFIPSETCLLTSWYILTPGVGLSSPALCLLQQGRSMKTWGSLERSGLTKRQVCRFQLFKIHRVSRCTAEISERMNMDKSVSIIISRRKIDSNPQALYNMGNYMGNTGVVGSSLFFFERTCHGPKWLMNVYITSYRHRKNKLRRVYVCMWGDIYETP